jgi:hypothetical protein
MWATHHPIMGPGCYTPLNTFIHCTKFVVFIEHCMSWNRLLVLCLLNSALLLLRLGLFLAPMILHCSFGDFILGLLFSYYMLMIWVLLEMILLIFVIFKKKLCQQFEMMDLDSSAISLAWKSLLIQMAIISLRLNMLLIFSFKLALLIIKLLIVL